MLAFTSLAVLFSVATRNGIVGVVGPALVDLVMQLLLLVGPGVWLHMPAGRLGVPGLVRAVHRPPVLRAAGGRVHRQRDLDRGLPGGLVADPPPPRLRGRAGQPPAGLGGAGPRRGRLGGAGRVPRDRQQLGPGRRHRGEAEGEPRAGVQQPDPAPAARARPEVAPGRQAQRAHELQPAGEHPVRTGRLDLHARRVHPAAGRRAVPARRRSPTT